ncbi:MAG: heat-inducible transcription repressor HrcA [Rhizobiaceae bacterium]|nr:heat-inducible transcription repressor HrcA [Rhizobiaceae bacterium]
MNMPPTSFSGQQADSLDGRSRAIFRHIVETYLATGEPLGSRNLARQLALPLSPASIRNVMSDLEHLGLIYAPHISAGRLPTEQGLRYFVDGFLEIGDLTSSERSSIEAQVRAAGQDKTVDAMLTEASQMLSGLTHGAGLVIAGKSDVRLKHIEFVRLEATKALVVIVGESGAVENRILELPPGLSASTLIEASNYLNAHIAGKTLGEARRAISSRLNSAKNELDNLAKSLVDQGLATWAGASSNQMPQLIVRGRGNLLESIDAQEDLARLRHLFDELETKDGLLQLLDLAEQGEGVKM